MIPILTYHIYTLNSYHNQGKNANYGAKTMGKNVEFFKECIIFAFIIFIHAFLPPHPNVFNSFLNN